MGKKGGRKESKDETNEKSYNEGGKGNPFVHSFGWIYM